VRWELEEPFDGQLCQEYLCKKSLKCANPFKVTIHNVGVPFLRHSVSKRDNLQYMFEILGHSPGYDKRVSVNLS